MARIIILNGAARKNGSTKSLVDSFIEGAESSGNDVREFYLNGMDIHGCIGCKKCMKDADPCVFKDDMDHIYRAFEACDVVVFASPMYWWTITGQLLTAVDRLYAIYGKRGPNGPKKDCVLLMTAGGDRFDQPVQWYSMFDRVMGWNDLGMVLGSGKEAEARALGASIQ